MLSGLPLGVLLALGATAFFSGAILISTVASRRLDSNAGSILSGVANVAVGGVLIGLQALAGATWAMPTWRGVVGFVLGGLCGTFLGRWLFFSTIRHLGPTRATVFQTLSPLAAALMAWVFLGQHLGLEGWLGTLIAAAGLILLTPRAGLQPPASGPSAASRLALAWGLGSAVAYAAGSLFRSVGVASWNEPMAGATLGSAFGLAALLLVARRRLRGVHAQIRAHPRSTRLFLLVGALQIVAQASLIASLNHIPVALTVLLTSCTPLLVMPLSAWLLRKDESLDARAVIGVLITCAGVALATAAAAGS